ncbi:MAG TPA: hypothetical protein VHU24_03240 [Solirubrobacterales bacterium]|jgi:hypothetical protein|nr:hypothetical protein [Solirubrobacterales bacterium]
MHLVGDPYTSEEILAVVERHYGRGKHNTRGVRALEYDLWESPVVMSHAERCRIQYLRKLDLLNSELAVIGDA